MYTCESITKCQDYKDTNSHVVAANREKRHSLAANQKVRQAKMLSVLT